jgi:hypothetical protein
MSKMQVKKVIQTEEWKATVRAVPVRIYSALVTFEIYPG